MTCRNCSTDGEARMSGGMLFQDMMVAEGGGRKIGENKALTAKKNRFAPYEGFAKCKIYRSSVHQKGSHYCQGCAYKKGICAMCGKKIIETKNYRQTSV
ncbi:cysteine-rich PDZ-binding protein-like [Mytilus galloprovincialis]|uniref:cysteine-rich PDZ-binding protein-like n=1 Tax=Mytilus galloprovincialis TaxID=29158 RepID=UPI003F7C6CA4